MEDYERAIRESYRNMETEELSDLLNNGMLTDIAKAIAIEELGKRGEDTESFMQSELKPTKKVSRNQPRQPRFSPQELSIKVLSWKVIPLHVLGGLAIGFPVLMTSRWPIYQRFDHYIVVFAGCSILGIFSSLSIVRHVYSRFERTSLILWCLVPVYILLFFVLSLLAFLNWPVLFFGIIGMLFLFVIFFLQK